MSRLVQMITLASFLAVRFGVPMSMAGEPAPTEQKEKKDINGGKAEDDSKKKDEKGMGGK